MASKLQMLLFDYDTIPRIEQLKSQVIIGDETNIREMMPFLFETQVEDVARAERRFEIGKGYLFTNGTGTGKTFVGLGVAKRFYEQNKRNILIVVPTEKKCRDWSEEAEIFKLDVHQLADTTDAGKEITVTTYANFYQNEALLRRTFDLIIYDEAHYLNQNAQGYSTTYYDKHRKIANLPSEVKYSIKHQSRFYDQDPDDDERQIFNTDRFYKAVRSIVERTKVLFLSATPFAYHKSVKYADGCLFDIYETIEEPEYESTSYNEPTGFSKFMVEHFGYQMRYNKCTVPESGVDVNLLERNFFEKHCEMGVMSTRQITLAYDYSREFVTINSEIGEKINQGFELFWNFEFRDKYPLLSDRVHKKHNRNYILQLLECIKAREIHTRVNRHLALGRKVVIFHNYNNSLPAHPFQFTTQELLEANELNNFDLSAEISRFQVEYADLWNLDIKGLINTRRAILKHFPDAKEFNGTINKTIRSRNLNEFNADNSEVNVLIVQVKAGQEGISLHDKTGVHQRALINLGLPTAPTQAIQIEGRIYREGLRSNAVYEYVTLQTNTERFAFATTIAQRSKTAENLAMGNLARDLETAFKEGYINSHDAEPSTEQGTGGKESDKYLFTISEFDKAKTFYYQRGKKTSRNKSKEGVDYFATPEPLGMKMVQWLNAKPNDKLLEPSAGHGAIARWFPGDTTNHFIEQSHELASELAINTNGTVHNQRFESYYIGNKFTGIVMNPPFGVGGKTAMEHVAKACRHLEWWGGEVLAIVPAGTSMDKRLEKFLNDEENHKYRLTGEVLLPSCTFERAGTSVSCKIIRIQDGYHRGDYKDFRRIDLTYAQNANEFFDAIEHLIF